MEGRAYRIFWWIDRDVSRVEDDSPVFALSIRKDAVAIY